MSFWPLFDFALFLPIYLNHEKSSHFYLKQSTDFDCPLTCRQSQLLSLQSQSFSNMLFFFFLVLNWLKPSRKNIIAKISDLPVDVSLTLTVNVTSDCLSQWHDGLLEREKKSQWKHLRGKKNPRRNNLVDHLQSMKHFQKPVTVQLPTFLIKHP